MRAATKVAFNTIFLYIRLIVSMMISLVSVPLILKALGASDYGLYNLVAGVVSMLSFLTNSMTISSQRFLSVTMGTNDIEKVDKVYNASFFIHFLLGLFVVFVFESGAFFISKLNIPADRIDVAMVLYQLLIINTFINIIKVPFDALINANEDLLVFSVIGTIDSFLKLAIAFSLLYITLDKLIFYGIGVLLVSLFSLLMVWMWTRYAYKSFRIRPSNFLNRPLIRELSGFAGWNLFGGLAMVGRNQGVSVIINLFLGTISNAAYGIANQMNGALSEFSAVLPKALNPQLMKSEGMNDRGRLIRISFISSRVSVLAFSVFAVPLILEMPTVLKLWLGGDIPPYTEELSQFILLFSIVYQFSNGLMSSIQATGKIRNYQIVMGLIILTNIPIAYTVLHFGYPIYYVTAAFVIVEIVSLMVRIYMAHRIVGMKIVEYFKNVIWPTLIIIGGSVTISLIPHLLMSEGLLRLMIVSAAYIIQFSVLSWFFLFESTNQRDSIVSDIRKRISQSFIKNRF